MAFEGIKSTFEGIGLDNNDFILFKKLARTVKSLSVERRLFTGRRFPLLRNLFLDVLELLVQRLLVGDREPLEFSTSLPLAVFTQSLLERVGVLDSSLVLAKAVLLPVKPVAFVDSAVGPRVNTVALLLVAVVLALVLLGISPDIDAITVHVSVFPFALILAAIF